MLICRVVSVLMLLCCGGLSKELIPEARLHREIFTDYLTDVRPVLQPNTTTGLDISFFLIYVEKLDEREQTLSALVWILARWKDELLQWTPENYSGLSVIAVGHDRIWLPDIMIRNEVGNEKGLRDSDNTGYSKPLVYSNGTVDLWSCKQVRTRCLIDVSKYPFDYQKCSIQIGKWYSSDELIDIFPYLRQVDLSLYEKSEEWQVVSTRTEKKLFYEDNSKFSRIFFEITLKRRSLYYILNVLVPILLLSALNQLSFVLPIESGEKIGMCVAIFLTFAVFLTMISESLPKSSVHTPAFGVYLLVQISLSGVTIASQVMVLYLYHKSSNSESGETKRTAEGIYNEVRKEATMISPSTICRNRDILHNHRKMSCCHNNLCSGNGGHLSCRQNAMCCDTNYQWDKLGGKSHAYVYKSRDVYKTTFSFKVNRIFGISILFMNFTSIILFFIYLFR